MNEEKVQELLDIINQAKVKPVYKIGDSKEYLNYRGITMGNAIEKIHSKILQNRLQDKLENTKGKSECI